MASSSVALDVFSNTIGAIFIAVLLSSVLFGILSVQVRLYYSQWVNDPRWMQFMVALIWLIDFIHTFLAGSISYDYTISNFHRPQIVKSILWPFSVTIMIEPFNSIIVQLFFARRLYLLDARMRSIAFLTAITCFVSFGAGEVAGVFLFVYPDVVNTRKFNSMCFLWLGSAALSNMLVTGPLIYALLTMKTGYEATDRIVSRILVWVISTGLLTASFAFLKIFVYMTKSQTMICAAANIILAKIYSVSLLAFLNRRGRWDVDKANRNGHGVWHDEDATCAVEVFSIDRNSRSWMGGRRASADTRRNITSIMMTVSTLNHVDSPDSRLKLSLPPDDLEESEREAVRVTPPDPSFVP